MTGSVYKIPLLPRPPKTAGEIEELRQRRMSSDSGTSVTRSLGSLKADESSSEDDAPKMRRGNRADASESAAGYGVDQYTTQKGAADGESASRKASLAESEYLLELPDEDDQAPLSDFNDKSVLKQYSDGSYSCVTLVRQPFRTPQLLYKNALQKMTEVRTWTECLVRLVDSSRSTMQSIEASSDSVAATQPSM